MENLKKKRPESDVPGAFFVLSRPDEFFFHLFFTFSLVFSAPFYDIIFTIHKQKPLKTDQIQAMLKVFFFTKGDFCLCFPLI